ncbi:5-oxoprolinase subunit PxpA [Winogradskyella forsetii]|uniref:5-oxoprolinase subunit PxpA n=1 Tax=Winogradskyella forsetii TaxID=2686077 RepID=UPI00277B4C83|nr:5-oxoprolinase subunit PxpA [Winogradskyella forsetii]
MMKSVISIDINADVGEGLGNEAHLLPLLSSCNIACGGHAGDEVTMRHVIMLAKKHHVKVGAHPSFPDKLNFGRVNLNISDAELYTSIIDQISALKNIAEAEGVTLNHIKPHGALYNLAAKDEKTARLIIEVIKRLELPIALYAPFNSVIANLAKQENIAVTSEAFADRNYNDDLSLVSRTNSNAILHEKEAVLSHVLNMLKNQKVTSISGMKVPIKATTICVHGDTKNAIEILKYLSSNLKQNGIQIQ